MPPNTTALIALALLAAVNAPTAAAAQAIPSAAASAIAPAIAITPVIAPAARLAATCAACHGTAGDTRGGTLPRLAGQSQQALTASLQAFKTGKRESTIMSQIAKGYTDEQIAQLAAYFAAQK
ncbi:c-type cytochrome [Duganella radicis]|uniref:C-type cytochrome n=1 Tax=Duganella radicis TaxID=551988 RepID=A0A6L6PLS4_9BURK|nr:c-type cytochrome [Duganella radicis]MTV39954.1 c-type cytochrome [Duganella radicis]